MGDLATILRFLQIYSHNAHNQLSGTTFFQDHSFLGELYPAYESDYDDVIERMIGLNQTPDLISLQKQITEQLSNEGTPNNYPQCYNNILKWEIILCKSIELLSKNLSQGTIQLIGDIANKSEMRQYKLKQRLP